MLPMNFFFVDEHIYCFDFHGRAGYTHQDRCAPALSAEMAASGGGYYLLHALTDTDTVENIVRTGHRLLRHGPLVLAGCQRPDR